MKKVLLVVSLISVLLLTGCNKKEKVENNNMPEVTDNQQEIIVENTPSMENIDKVQDSNLSVEYNTIDDYNSIIKKRGNNYDAMLMPQNVFLNARLIKDADRVILKADVGNPHTFSAKEIKTTVNSLENSNEKEIKLGNYTIHKDYIEGFYRWYIGDFSLEYEFVDKSFDKTKWYNEDRIPYYITDSHGNFVKFEYKNGYYTPYSSSVPIGDIALIDDIKENVFELVLNDNDKIVLAHGNNIDKVLSEETYTVKELFKHESSPIIGTSYYNEDSFKIKDGVIYLYINDGGGN
jgi:hypothetical protein